MRNSLYMCRTYPAYTKKYNYTGYILRLIFDRLVFAGSPAAFVRGVRLMRRAFRDAENL